MDISNFENNTLLIADDDPTCLNILMSYLENIGYKVYSATDGQEVLEQVSQIKPALILLDVMMPQMDGFEACRLLKANDESCNIPVIFMTALTNTAEKIKGFEAGAIDYITKPIQYEEVSARINIHLTLQNIQGILEQQKTAIEQKNIELERKNMELDAFAQFVVRDLKKPLVRQSGFTKVLLKELTKLSDSEPLKFLQEIEHSRFQMVDVVDDMVLLAKARAHKLVMDTTDMTKHISTIKHQITTLIEKYHPTIVTPPKWTTVWGYAPWIEKVWETYISNAIKYGGSPARIELGENVHGTTHIRFWVRDNGLGISSDVQKQLFTPISDIGNVNITQEGYGLKLSIVRLLIEKCGGEVGVESQNGQGSLFYFTLPIIG
ncbi:MAG: hybrid sensor histidine kinase/response regulator [Thiomargarita sp.]|nr:hybrid sensor histidine kinase/response regulator [Thiomargarita sp.]